MRALAVQFDLNLWGIVMEMQYYLLCLATAILVAISATYGVKFLKKRNYLLGFEWLIVTFSASNALLFFLADIKGAYSISYFCDAFSRGFGIPLVAVAGLMAVTHAFRPTVLADMAIFALAAAGGVVLVACDAVAPVKPYFYVATWSAFSIYFAYFAKRLLNAGQGGQALGIVVALVAAQAIAVIYDFFPIPGDHEHMMFYTLAELTWAYLCAQTYYAYCALERAEPPNQLACDRQHFA